MTDAWTTNELERIGDADELELTYARTRAARGERSVSTTEASLPARSSSLPAWTGFVSASLSMSAVFVASAAPIPLYDVYRRSEGLSKADLSFTAVGYFVVAVTGLLVLGRLSDHLGRRVVSIAGLAVTAAGCAVLLNVHSAAPLIGGRMLEGVGAAIASSAIASYIVDAAPAGRRWLAAAVTTAAPMVGLTIGAIGSGALVEYAPHPRTLVYLLAIALLALCVVLLGVCRETVTRTTGAVSSLKPVLALPAAARPFLPVASAIFVSTWALGGFYQAFGPTISATQLGTRNTLVAAIVFASLVAPSAIGAPLSGRLTPAGAQRLGMSVFFGALVVVLVSLRLGSVVPFILASAVAGAAQGATFAGSLRALLAEVRPVERAGLLSVIYAISYTGAAVPSLVAGQLARVFSLFEIALGYGAMAAIACLLTLTAAHNPSAVDLDPRPSESS